MQNKYDCTDVSGERTFVLFSIEMNEFIYILYLTSLIKIYREYIAMRTETSRSLYCYLRL